MNKMSITGNIHEHHRGRRVVTLASSHVKRLAADFPGWGDKDYAQFLLDPEPGLTGTVTAVESHGSNPWTRYSVAFTDGTRAHGLVLGTDIAWATAYDDDKLPAQTPRQIMRAAETLAGQMIAAEQKVRKAYRAADAEQITAQAEVMFAEWQLRHARSH